MTINETLQALDALTRFAEHSPIWTWPAVFLLIVAATLAASRRVIRQLTELVVEVRSLRREIGADKPP